MKTYQERNLFSFLQENIVKRFLFFFAPFALFYLNKSLALLFKSLQPNSLDVWVKVSDIEIDAYLVPGTWLVFITAHFAYHSWSQSADQYLIWMRRGWTNKTADWWFSERAKSHRLWTDRILSVIGLLAGLFFTWIGLYTVWLKYSGVGP